MRKLSPQFKEQHQWQKLGTMPNDWSYKQDIHPRWDCRNLDCIVAVNREELTFQPWPIVFPHQSSNCCHHINNCPSIPPPFPWLWVHREAYGYPGKAMDSGRLSASASLSALQPAEQWFLGHVIRIGVEVHISKTSWDLLTLFPKPFPKGPPSLAT